MPRSLSDPKNFVWCVQVILRGSLVEQTRDMDVRSACVYYASYAQQFPIEAGYRLRIVGYKK